jgi:hypothetical protein
VSLAEANETSIGLLTRQKRSSIIVPVLFKHRQLGRVFPSAETTRRIDLNSRPSSLQNPRKYL